MGGRLANPVMGSGTVTPFVHNPSSAEMSSLKRAPIVAGTGQQANPIPFHKSRTSPSGSPVVSRFSEAELFSSGPGGGYVDHANPFEAGPSARSSGSESNTPSSDLLGIYHPRNAKEAELLPLRGLPIINTAEDDIFTPPFFNPRETTTDIPYPGSSRAGDTALSFARSTASPRGARPGRRFGSAVDVHYAGEGSQMRGKIRGVPEGEEPGPEIPPTYSSFI